MKKPLFLFLLLLTLLNNTLSQKEIKLDNNLTGIFSTNTNTTFGINYVGNNSIDLNKFSIDVGTTYMTRYNPIVVENEFVQRTNFGYEREKWDLFTTHQYNYSLLRKITSDNWLGIGGGIKNKYDWGKISISYAILYQSSNYFILPDDYIWRHSLRCRIRIDKKFWSISSEYFYQPNFNDFNDYIIFGTTKLSLFTNKQVNFIIQDVINLRTTSELKLIHNLTLGIGWKYSKNLIK
jgi:hypothetical protein